MACKGVDDAKMGEKHMKMSIQYDPIFINKKYKMQIEKRSISACQQSLYLLDRIMGDFYFLPFVYFDPLNFLS